MCADVEWDLSMAQRENRHGIKNEDDDDDDAEEEERKQNVKSMSLNPI